MLDFKFAEIFFNFFPYHSFGTSTSLILCKNSSILLTIRTLSIVTLNLIYSERTSTELFLLLCESYSFFIRDFSLIRTGSHHANKGERVLPQFALAFSKSRHNESRQGRADVSSQTLILSFFTVAWYFCNVRALYCHISHPLTFVRVNTNRQNANQCIFR